MCRGEVWGELHSPSPLSWGPLPLGSIQNSLNPESLKWLSWNIMAQTKKSMPSEVQDLWGLLQSAAKEPTSQWTIVKEDRISLEAKRNIKTCEVLRGQGNPYARITWKDGKFSNLPLDWHCQKIVEVGDYLSISSLKLLTKINQETGEELTCLYGRV